MLGDLFCVGVTQLHVDERLLALLVENYALFACIEPPPVIGLGIPFHVTA